MLNAVLAQLEMITKIYKYIDNIAVFESPFCWTKIASISFLNFLNEFIF